jgi:hypothetical protein
LSEEDLVPESPKEIARVSFSRSAVFLCLVHISLAAALEAQAAAESHACGWH